MRKIANRSHHTVKSRFAIVQDATEDRITGAARRVGFDRKTVRAWCRRGYDSPHRSAARVPPLRRKPHRRPRQRTLVSRERPGDCVQVDVKEVKVADTTCFHSTTIDDGTRSRLLRLYPQNRQQGSHLFFTTLRTTLPFPIRNLQVDNGTECPLACALTGHQAGMRLRSIKPRCPEQNGNVERRHRVDDEECWSRSTFESFAPAAEALLVWERRTNHERCSLTLTRLTPAEQLAPCASTSSALPSVATLQSPSSALGGDHGPTADEPLTPLLDKALHPALT